MTKNELITNLSEKLSETSEKKVTKKATEEILSAFVNVVTEALVAGDIVKVPDLGTFSVAERAERTGIIQMGDRKGETYTTPAHRVPRFKASKTLKTVINA